MTDAHVVVSVDPHLCMGVRSCIQAAPGSFVLDGGITARAVQDPPDDITTLVEAASACPNSASTLTVDGTVVFDPERQ